jgi:sec-independent protein translocase protein TatC
MSNNYSDPKEQAEMSFLDHLEALRWHLVRSGIAIVVLSILAFIYSREIFDYVIIAPKNPDFWTYRFLCDLSTFFLHSDELCIKKIPFTLINIDMSGQFTTDVSVSVITGLVVAFPYVFWELWSFIKPALHPQEKKYTRGIVFFTSLLFIMGVSFGYFIIAPLSINFLGTYQVSAQVENQIGLSSFISTMTTTTLATGLVFELPIVVYFLSKIGVLTPGFMRMYRKHAIVLILILAAIITPPDVTSQILVTIPILLLYEISIFISAFVLKNSANK